MRRGLFLAHNPPSPSNTHFPIEALKAAYEFLQAGIDENWVLFVQRKRGQEAEYQFCKSTELLSLSLPGNTTLKLWELLKGNYDRSRFLPTAYLTETGYIFVVLLDTSKYRTNG